MALGNSPTLKRPGAPVDDTDNGQTMVVRPPAAPADVNPLPVGTQVGSAARDAFKRVANTAVDTQNAISAKVTGGVNTLTSPLRSAGGMLADAYLGATGQNARPNAGAPAAGFTAPQLTRPFQQPTIDFQNTRTDVPVAHPDFSGVRSGTGTTAGQADVTDPTKAAAAFKRVQDTIASFMPHGAGAGAGAAVAGAGAESAPGVDSGVTIGGRKLNYGAMVNGVPTFSDGRGAGGIPRTMSDDTIKTLGDRLPTAPAQTSALASDALGYTPSTGEASARLTRPQITGSRPSAQDFAAADRTAIALRDPRSAAGIAARNLSMDATYGGTGRARAAAAQSLATMEGGTQQSALQRQATEGALSQVEAQGANALDQVAAQGQNALAAEDMRGRYGLQNTGLEIERARLTRQGHPVTQADGSIGLMDPLTGQVTPARNGDGSVVRALMPKDDAATKRTNELVDQFTKGVSDQVGKYLPTKDAPTVTPEIVRGFRKTQALAMGLPVVSNEKTGEQLMNVNGQWIPL